MFSWFKMFRSPVTPATEAASSLEGSGQQDLLLKLSTIIRHTDTAAASMAGNAEEVERRAEHIAQTSSEMMSELEVQVSRARETLQNAHEVNRQFAETKTAVRGTLQKTQQLIGRMSQGTETIDKLLHGFDRIEQTSKDTRQQFQGFGLSLSKMQGMLRDIKEISDQTQLLSLNAAIEAAHAGAAGAGSEVVTQEIRKLAGQSKKLTTELGSLTHRLMEQSAGTASVLDKQMQALADSSRMTGTVKQLLAEIGSTASEVISVEGGTERQVDELEQLYVQLSTRLLELTSLSEQIATKVSGSAEASQIQLVAMMELAASIDIITSLTSRFQQEFSGAGLELSSVKWTRAYSIQS